MFEVAEAYEVMMGRWSRQLAPLFVEFVGVRDGERGVLHEDAPVQTAVYRLTLRAITALLQKGRRMKIPLALVVAVLGTVSAPPLYAQQIAAAKPEAVGMSSQRLATHRPDTAGRYRERSHAGSRRCHRS